MDKNNSSKSKINKNILPQLPAIMLVIFLFAFTTTLNCKVLDINTFAKKYYHEDAKWYADNTPFFECSDKQIEEVYYYRWKL